MSNPFLLAATNPLSPQLLPLLHANPQLAAQQDNHGYSMLHAAASYNHPDLLRVLVNEFHVDVNLIDEDGETCLFVVETVEVAKCLVEELQIDLGVRNHEGMTAADRIEEEADYPDVALYLRVAQELGTGTRAGDNRSSDGVVHANGNVSAITTHPPPLPPGMSLDIQSDADQSLTYGGQALEADPEFKRRIEELAAKDDFHSDEGQRALRDLIVDAVREVGAESSSGREVRRKLG